MSVWRRSRTPCHAVQWSFRHQKIPSLAYVASCTRYADGDILLVILVQVSDCAAGEQWMVLRRFRQFEELHRGLLPVLSREPDANAYALPPKEVR